MKLVSKRKNRAKVEEMVLGFVFNKEHTKIALIKKNRPEWQKDKYNGIGGHIEKKETFQLFPQIMMNYLFPLKDF